LDDMNARKSLTAATISTVAMFSLFGANIAQAAPGGNGNGRNESIDLGPAPVQLHNDRAEVKNDCPSDDAWWHFVLAPNNGQYAFTSMNLNIGGTATLVAGDDIVTNGGQTDNVFVAVPAGADLNDLTAASSSAIVAPYSMNVKFVLSHVCEGSKVVDNGPVAEEEVIEEPAIDEEVTEEEVIEEEAIEEDIATDEVITDIVTPTAVEKLVAEISDINEPVIEYEPTIGASEEAPTVGNVKKTAARSLNEVVEVTPTIDEVPETDAASIAAVAADNTCRNALPAKGMDLSLAFLGLGLAGLGGTLLEARRRLKIS